MAAARRNKRVAAGQYGFLPFNSSAEQPASGIGRRKRVNKNKKKNWNKYSDIQDVEEFLDDVRLQERATGGLLADKPDDTLFYVDTGEKPKQTNVPSGDKPRKGKRSKPLKIDLILQNDSPVAVPKDVLAYQQPNAKKLRHISQSAEKLAAKGVVTRKERLLQLRQAAKAAGTSVKAKPVANNNPERPYYDLWGAEGSVTADLFYLEQTKKKLVKRPDKMNDRPSDLPAIEVIAPGGSYNPDFFAHQNLLAAAHEVELKKVKEEEKLERQLARTETATEETTFEEQIQGLLEEGEDQALEVELQNAEGDDQDEGGVVPNAQQEKKTERQRKKERAEKIKEQQKKADRNAIDKRQQLFQLRSIRTDLMRREQRTRLRQSVRRARLVEQRSQPRRLGRLKFKPSDLEVQLSDELPGSLRRLKPEGSVLKDRFKSFQKRNMIEPRERAKFKRRHKLKYVEKRAFREIT
ncbi:ribosome biogenesis protein NOP53 [Denticeps clupeoides]|uniref:Ribosome biogenesis protein NOP53 n=1 Tax=Denticeps clupeoides TaxID=299321 RepID=A0AAY4DCL1_9TELE|nr:ribosome biogenesis protein NOP53 [Denticeps clupeoides]